ncbi:MAG: AbrB/MazE/SpoVT family DNA-binding domain-containing protein [Acidobacteria bacterium]|nr:AbrB/MazE/SpoVT family DNA-binding domain-containing protein [Acidobacteriota bacterium]
MITTIDSAGRIVLPKVVRERAQLSPGIPLEVRVVDGRIEIEPAAARVVVEDRGGLWVATPLEPHQVLTQDQVDTTIESLRAPAEPARGRD